MSQLSSTELAYLHEIVGLSSYTVSDVGDLATILTDEQRDLIRADIALWTPLRGKDTVMAGGKYGVNVDPERQRRRIRVRTLERLGIAGVSVGGLFSIPVRGSG
jgi:hypothetical protein